MHCVHTELHRWQAEAVEQRALRVVVRGGGG